MQSNQVAIVSWEGVAQKVCICTNWKISGSLIYKGNRVTEPF